MNSRHWNVCLMIICMFHDCWLWSINFITSYEDISDEKNVIKFNKSVGTIWRTQQHTIEKTVISDEKNVIK